MQRLYRVVIVSVWVSLLLLTGGCKKNDFSVAFNLPSESAATYTLSYYASDSHGGFWVERVVLVTSGKADVVTETRNPVLVTVTAGNGAEWIFYAERGDKIEIKGSESAPYTWQYSGNNINRQLSLWAQEHRGAIEGGHETLNHAIQDYVGKNPGDEVSALLLYGLYDRKINPVEFSRLRSALSGKAADQRFENLLIRSDAVSGYDMVTDSLPAGKILLRKAGVNFDTLELRKIPSLIYYRSSNPQKARESIKKLDKLAREYPDTTSRNIIEIAWHTDSVSWVMSLSSDTLRNAHRVWTPLGFTDPSVEKLGIKNQDVLLVADRKGKITYRGRDLNEAIGKFKAELDKKENQKQ